MREVSGIAALRETLAAARASGSRIAFVPTMGALHEGHLALVDRAREHGDFVVMSIFVNPLQFAPGEDFERYPREPERDRALAAQRRVDLLFTPSTEELYPRERMVDVVPRVLGARWEGASRPGHFAGVLTVVAKLFNIVQPEAAVFGQKDIQQAVLIRAMARDLDFPVRVIVAPTVREPDGLALSSRNRYLSADERARALSLSRALFTIAAAYETGERDAGRLGGLGWRVLERERNLSVDYLAIVDPEQLEPVELVSDGTIVAVAARVGSTRLIDNILLGAP